MAVPESKSQLLEDDDTALLPEVPEGEAKEDEEFVDLHATPEPEQKPAAKAVAKAAAPKKEDGAGEASGDEEIPADLKGKTPAQLAKMYRDAQSLIGRQGQELGEFRRKADQLIQASLAAIAAKKEAAPAAKEVPAEQDDTEFFAKPKEAIARAIAEHPTIKKIAETLGQVEKDKAVSIATSNTERFNKAHPDAAQIIQDPEFRQWVGASKVRQQLLTQAHSKFDFDAGDEVFSTWKALKGVKAAPAAAEGASETDAATAASEAARALAKRKQALNAAKTPTGGNGVQNKGAAKKIYRRADVLKLMEQDPDRYEALSGEIQLAYQEGRVR